MRTAILGLGYVGATTAACLLKDGHEVVGVDVNPGKVRTIAQGQSPVVEPGVAELLSQGKERGLLRACAALSDDDVANLDLVIVCVGTPSRGDGKLNMAYLLESSRQLGEALRVRDAGSGPLLLAYRSTMPPGTMERLVLPTLQAAAGEAPGSRYEPAFNPEFLRESTAVKDYFSPPKIIVGERFPGATRRLGGIYDALEAPFFETSFGVAETVKFVDNSFHALKVAFANEVGRIAVSRGVDPQAVAEIFLSDTKLNVSPYYLKPGGPFGGSCLPKDLGAMLALARDAGLSVPVLSGARESNALHLAWLVQAIKARCPSPGPILQLGLSFKAGTDDLRNSPLLDLAEALLEAGYDLRVHDPDLDPTQLLGANLAVGAEHQDVLRERLMPDLAEAAAGAKLAILGKPVPGALEALPADLPVFNLNRLEGPGRAA